MALISGFELSRPTHDFQLTFTRTHNGKKEQPGEWYLVVKLFINNSPVDRAKLADLVKGLFPEGCTDLEELERGKVFSSADVQVLIDLEASLLAASQKLSGYLHSLRAYINAETETIGFE